MRPSIDPESLVRMLVVGYRYGIRSERRLCEEVYLNLSHLWFCRLGLEDEVPNHSTLSKNRHGRFRASDLFRRLFNEVLRRCMAAGLVMGEGFAVDASIIKANASRQRRWRVMKSIGAIQSSVAQCASTSKPLMTRRWRKLFLENYAHQPAVPLDSGARWSGPFCLLHKLLGQH